MPDQRFDTVQFPGRWMSFVGRCSRRYIGQELAEFGFGSGQFEVLLALYRMGGVSQETLADRIRIDKANVTRALRKLEDLGYVRRETDPDDQRIRKVFVTESGEAILEPVYDVLTRWSDIVLEGLDAEDRENLLRYLKVMAENAEKAVK